MGEFPSGYKFPDGTVKLHTDEDILAASEKLESTSEINWQDMVGHAGWRKCFGNPPAGSVEIEGSKAMPYAFPLFEKMALMIAAADSLYLSGCTIPEGLKLPSEIGESLYLRGCTIPEGLKNSLKKHQVIFN